MKLQSIRRGTVCNHTELGKSVRRAARKALPDFLDQKGFGFQDGGCQIFAEALHIWSNGTLKPYAAYATNRGGGAQHVFVGSDTEAIDSDGLATHAEMQAKLEHFEAPLKVRIRPYSFGEAHNIPRDVAASERIAALLRTALAPVARG